MKTLHKYVAREILATLVMTVAIFTFVLMLGNILREVFALLFNEKATLGLVLKAIGLLIPYVLVFALPMGMLTAALMVFGKMSAEQELIAAKSGGISVVALCSPALLLSLALSVVCALINMYWAPKCRVVYKDIIYNLGQHNPETLLSEGRFVKDIPGYIIYVGKIDGDKIYDVLISRLNSEGSIVATIMAPEGLVKRQKGANSFTLTLYDAKGATIERNRWQPLFFKEWTQEMSFPQVSKRRLKLNELTIFELHDELKKTEQMIQKTTPIPSLLPGELREKLYEYNKPILDFASPIKVQIHQQVSFSFACIGFTLIGIPLGIRAHRKETSIGVAISLFLVLIYYSFFILANAIEIKSQYAPHLIVWLPNFIFQSIGAVLLWRVNRM